MDNATFLTDRAVAARFGVSRTTIWRWTRAGLLPKPVVFSRRCTRWNEREVHEAEARAMAAHDAARGGS